MPASKSLQARSHCLYSSYARSFGSIPPALKHGRAPKVQTLRESHLVFLSSSTHSRTVWGDRMSPRFFSSPSGCASVGSTRTCVPRNIRQPAQAQHTRSPRQCGKMAASFCNRVLRLLTFTAKHSSSRVFVQLPVFFFSASLYFVSRRLVFVHRPGVHRENVLAS